jgi:hypothetical protein
MDILLQYFLYAIRWQFSTPSLAIISVLYLAWRSKKPLKWPNKDEWIATALANLVGSAIFFWVDMFIFKK